MINKMCSKNIFLATFISLIFSGASYAETCPKPPDWINLRETSENCIYSVVKVDSFSDIEFISFLDALTRNSSGLLKKVRMPAGEFKFSRSIKITGSNGWLLYLEGDSSLTTKFVFNGAHGFDIEGPFAIGLINKLTLKGSGEKGRLNDAHLDMTGILARRGAVIRLGQDVVVEEFSRAGVQAYMSSTIFAPSVISRNNGSDGFVASYNSTVYARNAVASGNRGDGFFAEAASTIDAEGSVAKGNVIDKSNGQQRGGDGYVAILGGIINANYARIESNEDQDFVLSGQGLISANKIKFKEKIKALIRDNSLLIIENESKKFILQK